MFSIKKSLISAFILSASFGGTALAEEHKGFYLTAGGGVNQINDIDWNETISGTKYTGDVEIAPDFSIDAGIGYDFGKLRTEVTYQNIPGDLDTMSAEKVIGSVGVTTSANADVDITSWFTTLYYDLPEYQIRKKLLVPYIGAGLGRSTIDIGTITVDGVSTAGGDDDVWAYQLKLGTSYEMNEKADLYVEGVYFETSDFEIIGTNLNPKKTGI